MNTQEEIWKEIPGFEGKYQVSNHGKVRSIDHVVDKRSRWGKVCLHSIKGRILKFGLNGGRGLSKYQSVILTMDNSVQINHSVHRLVASAFVSNPENKPEVNHKDCNKQNNHYSNLEWCTRRENVHYSAKISLQKVLEIKRLLADGLKQNIVAALCDVKPYIVQYINSERAWKHIKV